MTKLTTERLEQFIANPLGNPLYRTEQMDMARQLLAYEQAAKNKVALPEALKYAEIYGRAFICVDRNGSVHAVDPSQITLTILNEPANAQPVIPIRLVQAINRLLDNDGSRGCFDALEQHIAKTELERLLAAAQQNEPQNISENIPAPLDAQDLELYVDMLENSDSDDEDGELNNTQLIVWLKELQRRRALSAQPVSEPYKLPDGYCIMPKRLTAENGAKYALSGEFSTPRVVVCPECDGDGCSDCDGRGDYEEDQLIEWTTIKNIYSAAVSACALHSAAATAQESE